MLADEQVLANEIKRKKKKKKVFLTRDRLLNSGSTLLNLASTGKIFGCYLKGKYYWFVGDSTSGKTWLALSVFAEAGLNPAFADYRYIYDNGEDGALMDIERYFGATTARRIEPPRGTRKEPKHSVFVEDFYYNIDDAYERWKEDGRPFIYVMDSMDVLESREDLAHFKKKKSAARSNKSKKQEVAGSYGMQKAKDNSSGVRKIIKICRETGSIVLIISQTRDNVGFGAKFVPKRASGGRALKFYATLEIWTAVKEKLTKRLRGKERQIGISSKVQLKKNRITGKDRSVLVPIYHSIGVDDLGSCIDFLLEEKHWSGTEAKLRAPEFDFVGSREELVKELEQNEQEQELRVIVAEVWNEIEDALKVRRKKRYV